MHPQPTSPVPFFAQCALQHGGLARLNIEVSMPPVTPDVNPEVLETEVVLSLSPLNSLVVLQGTLDQP